MARLRLPLLLAISLLAFPAPASADHVQSSAQVSAAFSGPVKRDGSRELTVTWSLTCTAVGEQAFVMGVEVFLFEKPKSPARAPRELQSINGGEEPSGSEKFVVKAGTRAYAEVRVDCRVIADPDHEAPSSARSEVFYVPPHARGWDWASRGWCAHVGAPPYLQRGYAAKVVVFVTGSPISLLPVPGRQGWRDIRIRLSGAGVNRTVRANARFWARGYVVFPVRPRRAGKLKATVVFAGDATNTITIPVKRPPRGC